MKTHDHLSKLRQVAQGIGDSLQKVIVVPFCTPKEEIASVNLLGNKEMWIDTFLQTFAKHDATLIFEQVIDFSLRVKENNFQKKLSRFSRFSADCLYSFISLSEDSQ